MENIKDKYKDLIEELTFEQLQEKCASGEITNMSIDKAIVIDYMGNEPEKQADFLLNMLVDNDIVFAIELNPEDIFEKIYSIKSNEIIDIIAIMKDNKIDIDKFKELYDNVIDNFTIESYLKNQQIFVDNLNNKEEYDPLHFNESNAKLQSLEKDYEDGKISYGQFLKELGIIKEKDLDNEKVIDIVEKISKGEIDVKDLENKYKSNEITNIELFEINEIIKKKHPEIYEKFNDEY